MAEQYKGDPFHPHYRDLEGGIVVHERIFEQELNRVGDNPVGESRRLSSYYDGGIVKLSQARPIEEKRRIKEIKNALRGHAR